MDLRQYQKEGIAWLDKLGRGGILADEMGLGKSIQALLAAEGRTLIVAPAVVIDGRVWQDEIEKWGLDPDRFTLTSYHSLPKREKTRRGHRPTTIPRPEFRGPWDTLILDECHHIKERKTTWTQALQRVKAGKYIMQTGTPVPNWAHEIYMPLRLLHPRDDAFSSYWRWVEKYFKIVDDGFTKWAIRGLLNCRENCATRDSHGVCDHWRAFIQSNHLDKLMLRRYRDEVARDLPPLTEESVELSMGPSQARAYKQMRETFTADVEGGRIEAWSEAAAFMMLLRISTGLVSVNPERTGNQRASSKLEWVRDAMIQRADQGTIFYGVWRNTIQAMAKIADELGIPYVTVTGGIARNHRAARLATFQDGRVPFLIGTCQTIGEGLQLTAADAAVFVEHPWRPSLIDQCVRRIHRLGQTRPCHVWHLWTRDSIDLGVRATLESKSNEQVKMMTAQQVAALT